jgi:hypothetical protein
MVESDSRAVGGQANARAKWHELDRGVCAAAQ